MFFLGVKTEIMMFNVTVQKLGDVSVVHCKGRIVAGDACSILRTALLNQNHIRTLVLDLARVERIDAGGVGVLLAVRAWTRTESIRFKLMNVPKNVDQILELTSLQCVFEFCSVREMLCLLHRAASFDSLSVLQPYPADTEDRPYGSAPVQEAVPVVWSNGLTRWCAPRPNL